MGINHLCIIVVIQQRKDIDVVPSVFIHLCCARPDCADMHAGFEPVMGEHSLNGICCTSNQPGTSTGFLSGITGMHRKPRLFRHFFGEGVSVVGIRTEYTDLRQFPHRRMGNDLCTSLPSGTKNR